MRHSVLIDGRTVSYLECNAHGESALVLLHGGNSAAADWQDVADALGREHRILAPDLRGRGWSDWAPDQDYTVAAPRTAAENLIATNVLSATVRGNSLDRSSADCDFAPKPACRPNF